MPWRTRQLGAVLRDGGRIYDPAASALFAAMTTPPAAARKAHINAVIAALKAAGVWPLIEILYVMAAHDGQAARLNWKSPGNFTLSPQNAPTFTIDRDYQGDGATSYLDTGWDFVNNGAVISQNNRALGLWSRTPDQMPTGTDIGASDTTLGIRNSLDQLGLRVGAASSANLTNTDGSGWFFVQRTGAAASEAFRNNISLGTSATASTALGNPDLRLLGRSSGTLFSIRKQSIGMVSASMSAPQRTAAYSAFLAYMQAVGAA
jgi:hypothetical protein